MYIPCLPPPLYSNLIFAFSSPACAMFYPSQPVKAIDNAKITDIIINAFVIFQFSFHLSIVPVLHLLVSFRNFRHSSLQRTKLSTHFLQIVHIKNSLFFLLFLFFVSFGIEINSIWSGYKYQ